MKVRKIIFRGRVADEPNEWVYGYLVRKDTIYQTHDNGKGCCGIGSFTVIPESISQYTGISTLDGNPIYENDILKDVNTGQFFKVRYDGGVFYLVEDLCEDIGDIEVLDHNANKYKVVGTVYELNEE